MAASLTIRTGLRAALRNSNRVQPRPRLAGSSATLPATTGAGMPTVMASKRQPCSATAASAARSIRAGVRFLPEGILRVSSWPVTCSFTWVPPTSMTRIRLAMPPPARARCRVRPRLRRYTTLPGSPEQEERPDAAARGRAAWLAVLALPVVPVLWGYNWVVMKAGVASMAPFEFAAWRFIPAGLLLLGLLAVRRRPLRVRSFGTVAWAGILQTGVNTALSLFALEQGPAGRAALLCYTMPFWVVLLGWPLLRERPGRIQVAALVAAAAGLAMVFTAGAGAHGTLPAVVLATLSGLAWAWGAVLTRRLLVARRADPLAVAAWQMLFGGAALAAAALLVPGRPAAWSPFLVLAVLYEILPATAVAWVLWTALLRHVSAGVASLAILATPLVGLLASALQLGERPRGLEAAGLGLLVVALVLVGPLAVRQARAA